MTTQKPKYRATFTEDDRDTILWALNRKYFELTNEYKLKPEDCEPKLRAQLGKIQHAMSRLTMPEEI